MHARYWVIIGLASFLIAGTVFVNLRPLDVSLAEVTHPVVTTTGSFFHQSTSLDPHFFDPMFIAGETTTRAIGVVSGVIPHHLVAGVQLATFFETLQDTNPPVVVVLGPNHLQKGFNRVVTSLYDWKTPYGTLRGDTTSAEQLVDQKIAALDEPVMDGEWSVAAVTPFIKHTWPNTKLVPIIVKDNASSSSMKELANALVKTLPAGSLVLTSIDFSHYQPYFISDFHDILAENILATADEPA